MIETVRTKTSKLPDDNYTVAVCDECKAKCAESRQPGQVGERGWKDAIAAAHAAGWTDRTVRDPKRRRRMTWIVQLLCPACAEKNQIPACATPDDGTRS